MNLSQINPSSRFSNLIVNKTAIFHIIPEFGSSTVTLINDSGLSITNCQNMVIKTKPLKIGGRTFSSRNIYLDAKKEFENPDLHARSLRILQTIPDIIPKNKYIIIDHTITSLMTQYTSEITNTKRGLLILFQQLKKEFKFIKSKFPEVSNAILFIIDPTIPISIFEVLKKLSLLSNDEISDSISGFDNTILVSIKSTTPLILPIVHINKSGKTEILKANISYISDIINKKLDSTIITAPNKISNSPIISSRTKIIDNIIDSKYEINQTQLSKIIKKYKIKDKTVGDNIKNAVHNYMAHVKQTDPSDKNTTQEDLEKVIFKAIHHTIFGTDKVSEEYQDSPIKLISKLEEVNTYSKSLTYPDTTIKHIFEPNEIIQLDKVTGLVRQEYEFSDNIHINIRKLFSAIENKTSYPIKIKNFEYKYQDNNLNRFINYAITLENTSGGYSEPYTINIKIPALVNDRYFKLNGKSYILSNQQYMVPVTKTDPNECRLLTAYAIMTLSVVNLKFNISQLSEIIEYIKIKYPDIILKLENTTYDKIKSVTFKDGTIINILDSPYYTYKNETLIEDEHNKLIHTKDGEENILNIGKSEFLYNILLNEINSQNPNDEMHKSKKSIPYIQTFISGFKCPLILYLWQQLGLINALTRIGIDFEILDNKTSPSTSNDLSTTFFLSNDKKLILHNDNKREQLITNGLLTIDKKFKFIDSELNDKNSIIPYLQNKCGTKVAYHFDLISENMIDPITKDLLEFQDYPTELNSLICDSMIDKLLNDPADSLSDLKIYRSRQAEIMFHLMYKILMAAHNTYRNSVQFGDTNSKIFLKDEYVIECLLGVHPDVKGNSSLELTNTYSPVAELKAASKIIKSGIGGIFNCAIY